MENILIISNIISLLGLIYVINKIIKLEDNDKKDSEIDLKKDLILIKFMKSIDNRITKLEEDLENEKRKDYNDGK